MAAPYGTRSRNRGGRINYAEDKDIETDVYEYYDKKGQDNPKKPSRKSDAGTNGDNTPRSVTSRRTAAEETKASAASQNGSKDTTPGITTSASQVAAPPSGTTQGTRKRKAATTTTTSVPNKKAGQVVHGSGTAAWPDSNMLTFENCNHRVDASGRMVADDGTVLEPNGKCACSAPSHTTHLHTPRTHKHTQAHTSTPTHTTHTQAHLHTRTHARAHMGRVRASANANANAKWDSRSRDTWTLNLAWLVVDLLGLPYQLHQAARSGPTHSQSFWEERGKGNFSNFSSIAG